MTDEDQNAADNADDGGLFGPLVEADWLRANLGDPGLRVLDATWHLPTTERDGFDDYLTAHIPGAVYFDIDAVADQTSRLPHMLPSAEVFGAAAGAMGVNNDDRVVVYDHVGAFSAPRVWWMFRVFGHQRVAVLNGGLKTWRSAGGEVDSGDHQPVPGRFGGARADSLVRGMADVKANLKSGAALVVDARSAGRFTGTAPEVRPGIRSGHIPGARNVPYDSLLDPADGRFLGGEDIGAALAAAGVTRERPIITSCGSGVTACVVALGLTLAGRTDVAVYDGSWTEWGGRDDLPIETGGAA